MSYKSKFTGAEVDDLLQRVKDGRSVTIDTELSETSTNPLANQTVTAELEKKVNAEFGKGLSTNDFTDEAKGKLAGLLTIEPLSDAEALKAAFEKHHFADRLNVPIPCFIKEESYDKAYQSVILIVEKYPNTGYKLNFINIGATSKFNLYDENGVEIEDVYDQEWQWSPKCKLTNGVCNSYLIQDNGYVMHLGKGEIVIADDKLDASSDRPISNKGVAKAINDVADDAKVLMLPNGDSILPQKGVEGKIYYLYDRDSEHLNPYVWWLDKWIPMTHSTCVYYGEGNTFYKVYDAVKKYLPCICIDNREFSAHYVYYLSQERVNSITGYPELVFSSPNSQKNLILEYNSWSEEQSAIGELYDTMVGSSVDPLDSASDLRNSLSKLLRGGKFNASINIDGRIIPCSCSAYSDIAELKYLDRAEDYIVEHTYLLLETGELQHTLKFVGREEKEISVSKASIFVYPNEYLRLKKGSLDSCLIELQSDKNPMYKEYIIEYNGGDFISIGWPENIRWANRKKPTQNKGSVYQVRIVNNLGSFVEYLRSEISFMIGNQGVSGEQGMTWEEWIGSSYNSIDATILNGIIMVDDQVVVWNSEVKSTDLIISGAKYTLQSAMSPEEMLVGTYNHSATSTGGATLGSAYLPTIAIDSSGNLTMSSLLGNSSSGPVANATYNDTAKTFTVLKGWTHPMFGPVDVDIVFDVDFNSMTLTAKSNFTVGGWATISGYKLVKKS